MRAAAFHLAVATFAALLLTACAQQGRAPPAIVDTPADLRPAHGRYAVMLTSTDWTLKAEASMMWLCPSPQVSVDASAAYQDAMRDALRRSLGNVTFVSVVMTPAQLKAQGFDGEVVVAKGKGRSNFAQSTGAADVSMSVTVTVHGSDGNTVSKTVAGQGSGKATTRMCMAVTDAIGASASEAVSSIARQSAVFVAGTLNHGNEDVVEAPPPKPKLDASLAETAPTKLLPAKTAEPMDVAANTVPSQPKVPPAAVAAAVPANPTSITATGNASISAQSAFIRGANAAAGRDGAPDDVAAMKWFRIAADKGYAPAQNNLGYLYAEGRGALRDDAEAVRWYKKAAQQQYPPAETSLGMMYAQGRGVSQSDSDALALYSAAANQGYPQAKANLAEMYREGRGVARDDMTAGFLLASVKARPMLGSGIYVEPYVDPEKFPGQ